VIRMGILLVGVIAAMLVASAGALGSSAAPPTLKGTVGPGFTINLTMNGKKVKALKAGRYRFVISDRASIHNFALEQQTGGKYEKSLTTVPYVGTRTVVVTLKKGAWRYVCVPHASSMFGTFTVR